MEYSTFVGVAMATGVVAWLVLIYTFDACSRWAEPQLVNCPASNTTAALETDRGLSSSRVVRCSYWPQRCDCSQACLAQLENRAGGTFGRS